MFQEDLKEYLKIKKNILEKLGILDSTLIIPFLEKPWFTGTKDETDFIFYFNDLGCSGLPYSVMFPAFWWGYGSNQKGKHRIVENETLCFHANANTAYLFSMSQRLSKEQAQETLTRNAIKNWSIAKEINGIKVTDKEIKQ